MARLFISQDRLDAWNAEQRVQLDGDVMTLADDGRSFKIRPAVRFLRLAGAEEGDVDPHELIGTVKAEKDLEKIGADYYIKSVILGEVAYDVQPGFLGDPLPRTRSGGG